MTEKSKKRHPAAAALLSLCLMGLGQLYNGQRRRAIVFLALDILPYVLVVTMSGFLLSFQGIMIFYLAMSIFLGIRIFSVVDAFRGARRVGAMALQRYNRWYVYVSVFFAMVIVQSAIEWAFERPVAGFSIPSGAMQPTLLVGDYLYANKKAYADRAPERGDIAIFRKPPENEIDYIKRIVGLPGDRIQMLDGVLHINGAAVDRVRIEDFTVDSYGREITQYEETLPNGRTHRILEDNGDEGRSDNTKEFVVPEGHYFVLGDNRDNSADSRVIGFIPAENMVGRAEILFFSIHGSAAFWEVWKWPSAIRYERIGSGIDQDSKSDGGPRSYQ